MPTEALPNKVFEYMACGLPILSSLHGEAQRLIENAGVGRTYRPGDLEKFVEHAVALSADDAGRAEMGVNGRQLYDRICSAEVSYDAYAEYVGSVARHAASGRGNAAPESDVARDEGAQPAPRRADSAVQQAI